MWNFNVGDNDITKFLNGLINNLRMLRNWIELGDSIVVAGYAIATGNENTNEIISQNRANKIKNWFTEQVPVPDDRIWIEAGGVSTVGDPSHPYKLFNPESYAFNRRVEIRRVKRLWSDEEEDN